MQLLETQQVPVSLRVWSTKNIVQICRCWDFSTLVICVDKGQTGLSISYSTNNDCTISIIVLQSTLNIHCKPMLSSMAHLKNRTHIIISRQNKFIDGFCKIF